MKETGTLIIGVEYEGTVYREFCLEPVRVKDTLACLENTENASEQYFGVLSISRQLKMNGIPKEAITPEFVLDMYEEDMDEILKANGRLKERIAGFRRAAASAQNADAGRDETGLSKA